ncbi:MAG: glycosyltransferase family 2 protein [Chloroflexota bacterium]|nr:glycosyltransferase family 2 protein [Chloroflexota bacterium]
MGARTAQRDDRSPVIPSPRALRPGPAMPLLTVVVPTFNEQDNVEVLVDRLIAALAGSDFEIIFVDDSTDDTPRIVMGLQRDIPIKLIHREAWERGGGLTTAIVRGLRAARGEYVSVIDGDLQHPPEKLADMLAEARRRDADVVVASRYREGGSADGLPGATRRLISLGSKWLSKLLFYERLRHTSDPGSGFFLLRRGVIDGVELRPVGYKMLTEVLVRGRWQRLVEVPYRFQSRNAGESKATLKQGSQYLQHTARIFLEVPEVARVWKFLLVGASGMAVNLGVLWLATSPLGLAPHAGWAAGVEASVLSNFWLNRSITWRDRRSRGRVLTLLEAARYHVACALGVTANLVVFTAAVHFGAATMAAGFLGVVSGLMTNFAGASRFAFPVRAGGEAAQRPAAPAPRPRPLPRHLEPAPADVTADEQAA